MVQKVRTNVVIYMFYDFDRPIPENFCWCYLLIIFNEKLVLKLFILPILVDWKTGVSLTEVYMNTYER